MLSEKSQTQKFKGQIFLSYKETREKSGEKGWSSMKTEDQWRRGRGVRGKEEGSEKGGTAEGEQFLFLVHRAVSANVIVHSGVSRASCLAPWLVV